MRPAPRSAVPGATRDLVTRFGAPPEPVRVRIEGTSPGATAIAPATPEDMAAALAICSAAGQAVRVCGAATRLRGSDEALIVSTARLRGITEHEPADLVIGVRAGTPLSELRQHLEERGQWLPLDPAVGEDATIGGVVAQRLAGPLRALHGTPRDMLLGAEVVTGDGRCVRFGGRVVKNVAGYDAVRLLVGSAGKLGVLTHLFLRLRGRPRHDATVLIAVPGPREGIDIGLRVRDVLSPDALELLSPWFVNSSGWTVAIRVTGSEAAVEDAVARIARISGSAERVEQSEDWWAALASRESGAGLTRWRRPVSELAGALAALAGCDPVAVHLADGIVRCPAGPARDGRDSERSEAVEELTRRLRAVFDPAGMLMPRKGR